MRSLPFWSTCLVVAGAALAYPAAAYACTPDSKEYKEATARTEQAAKRYSDKDYNGSRVAMAQAYALCPTYKTLRNLIMTEVASG